MRRVRSRAITATPPISSGVAASENRLIAFLRSTVLSFSKFSAVLLCAAVPPFVESRARVRYAETDQMGIAHHANYIVWFEIGRTDLCRATGFPYKMIEERGLILVVTEVSCRYRAPYHYDDEVLIRTQVTEAASRAMTFGYELRDGSGERLHATGLSKHVWVDRETRRPTTADAEVMKA